MVGKALLYPASVILVSGGGRGITAQCVIRLARHTACKFILLGRTDISRQLPEWVKNVTSEAEIKRLVMNRLVEEGQKATPKIVAQVSRAYQAQKEIESTLWDIRQAGAEVEYIAADVTGSIEMLKSRLAEPIARLGKISGLIHGAGMLADRRIEKKTTEDFNTVFLPKVTGLQNLLQVAPASQLDFLVLFSSVAGFFGNIGQADYAMANEVLNKTAHQVKRDNPSCHVVSINWGPWDSGMVTPELKRAFADRNMAVIPVAEGAEWLLREITDGYQPENQPVQVVVGSLPTRIPGNVSGGLQQHRIRRHLSLDANPFLLDHIIGNKPVLPATCAASWLASAAEQRYPGFTVHLIEDFKVLKGIVFDETLAGEHVLTLNEIEKVEGEKVHISGKVSSQHKNGHPLYHYSLNATLLARIPPPPIHVLPAGLLNDKGEVLPGKSLYENGTLFHGPSFQGVRQVIAIGDSHLVMEVILPPINPEQQGQFPLQTTNPFVYDAIVQSLLIWTQRIYNAPCLPSHLVSLEHYKPIPFNELCLVDLQIVSHNKSAVVADIWVTDTRGEVFVKFNQLQGTISPLLKRLLPVNGMKNPRESL